MAAPHPSPLPFLLLPPFFLQTTKRLLTSPGCSWRLRTSINRHSGLPHHSSGLSRGVFPYLWSHSEAAKWKDSPAYRYSHSYLPPPSKLSACLQGEGGGGSWSCKSISEKCSSSFYFFRAAILCSAGGGAREKRCKWGEMKTALCGRHGQGGGGCGCGYLFLALQFLGQEASLCNRSWVFGIKSVFSRILKDANQGPGSKRMVQGTGGWSQWTTEPHDP